MNQPINHVEYRKDLFADERDDVLAEVGQPTIRQDILGHVTGRSPYYDDHLFDGLLHIRCVRSPHHHARIRSVDSVAAERMPGVVRLIRASDIPVNMNTLLSLIEFGRDDEPLLATDKVAYRGQPLLAIIATSPRAAEDAAAAVRVDYEVLPHVLDVEEALAPGAPSVNEEYPNNSFDYHERYDHQKLRFGDVEAAFRRADHIVEANYQMAPIEQAPIETGGAIAAPETNDRIVCYTGTQALFFSVGVTAKQLDMSSSRLHFIGGTVGGGFGGKVDSHHEPLAVLGALLTGRAVKYQWDRAEEMQVSAPRSAERWRIKDGVMRDGSIIARQFTGFFDAGAYTRLTSYGVQKCTGHLPGPYTIPNVASNAFCVFTNRTPATAMRGFGITGVDFAIECHMDKVAEQVGMDPIELRILNAYRDGDMKAHRRSAKNCALIEATQVVASKSGWRLSPDALAASSMVGGGIGWRGEIPETSTDTAGEIGQRRRDGHAPDPYAGATARGTVAAGYSDPNATSALGNAPQDTEMEPEAERLGFKTGAAAPPAMPPVATSAAPRPAVPGLTRDRDQTAPTMHPDAGSSEPYRPMTRGPTLPSAAQPSAAVPGQARDDLHTGQPSGQTSPTAPAAPGTSAQTRASEETEPMRPGPRRPGVSGFLRGRRR